MAFDPRTRKRMIKMLIFVSLLFGGILAYKVFINHMMQKAIASNKDPVMTVSAMKVSYSPWQPQIMASGSLRAIRGVNVTAQLSGMVGTIYFTPGAFVEKDEPLVQQNANSDLATLHSLEANAELARITYERDKAQYWVKAVSKQTVDADRANLQSLRAQVASQAATVAKKTIRAPFTGRLGISAINPGQFLNPGDTIVMLQTLDPIYADFYVPQQKLGQLKLGQLVTVTTDAYPGKEYQGKITTINPGVDPATRNVGVEATIDNPQYELAPGMFASVMVNIGDEINYLTLPQSAISFNPYGELVYVIKETGQDDKKKSPLYIAHQVFVETGDARGDQIEVLKGIQEGDMIVTSGQVKLKNGSRVVINNSITPPNSPHPAAPDEH